MNILNYLTELTKDFGTVEVLPVSEFKKEWNKKQENVKDLYTIKIVHKDKSIGTGFQNNDVFSLKSIAPSKYMSFFYEVINEDLLKGSKLHCGSCSECGNTIEYDITWIRG